nr:MAG TPA: Cro/C1-type HTH DNA-binding domain protein [Caudoviricetes sp.]
MLKKHTAGLSSNDLDQICELLNCQPGDLMEYTSNEKRL